VIRASFGRLAGADITGDVSTYSYGGLFKRLLSRLDGHGPDAASESWRGAQQAVNAHLLALLRQAVSAPLPTIMDKTTCCRPTG